MQYKAVEQPKNRTPLRLTLGKGYFRFKRRLFWRFSGLKFAKQRFDMADSIHYQHFSHKTPLLRQLKDVDMWMQHNKIINLRLAVKRLDGVVVKPGETLSYWRLIGKPTRRKGYVDGMLLKQGQVMAGVGGGLCQLSNLIYWMAIHTPLTVSERHRHSFDVFPDANRTQPFGSGATCFYNYVDLMIKNETDQPFLLTLQLTDSHLEGKWLSTSPPTHHYEVYEKSHAIHSQFWGGYTRHNTIHRRVFCIQTGTQQDDQFVTQNHAVMMYNPLIPQNSPLV
ncbi:MAG: VanW family protein [Defluviitaleaceae bacterium]|nr:VanW family protein [Defluviitaleaceae bacterium]